MTEKQYLTVELYFNNGLRDVVTMNVREGSTVDEAWNNIYEWRSNSSVIVEKNDRFPGCFFNMKDIVYIKRVE